MFERLKEYLRGKIMNFVSPKTISEAVGVELPVDEKMYQKIKNWKSMYSDDGEWTGKDEFLSAGIASSIVSELSRLSTVEMEVEVLGESKRAELMREVIDKVVDDLPIQVEYAGAMGGLILKPYLDGDVIAVDYVQADNFFPVSFNSRGEMTSVIFKEVIYKESDVYTRLEYHEQTNDIYKVINKAYKKSRGSKNNNIGEPVALDSVEEWKSLEDVSTMGAVEKPLYSYLKMPVANTVDMNSHLGMSLIGRAENLIVQAEMFWNSIQWEYDSKETAIDLNETMLKPVYGEGGLRYEVPKGKERLFRVFDANKMGDETFYKVYSPEIRSEEFNKRYNQILQRIEFASGLAYGTISDPNIVARTATEIRSSKHRSYSTVTSIQNSIKKALEDLTSAVDIYCDLYRLGSGEYELRSEFGDSVLVDTEKESVVRMQEVASGLLKPEEYLKWRYGYKTDEEARMVMPNYSEIADEITDDLSHTEE